MCHGCQIFTTKKYHEMVKREVIHSHGHQKNVFQGGKQRIFQNGDQKHFPEGSNHGEIKILQLKTNRKFPTKE